MVPNPNPKPAGGMNGLEGVNKGDAIIHQNWFNEYTSGTTENRDSRNWGRGRK